MLIKVIKIPSLNRLRDKAQKTFNEFIRNRDKDLGCISCGGPVEQAGHFYNAGQYSGLRFVEENCAGQCISCNYHKHGNLLHYRAGLLKRIGEQKMLLLESSATRDRVKKWTRTELEIIYKIYKEKNKE